MHNSIYSPEEDSYMMSEILKEKIPRLFLKNQNLKILEIGAGSGINLETLSTLGVEKQNILSSDINPEAVKHCKKLGFNCIKSDLFSKIPKQKFDVIIFNPPYLPEDKIEPLESKTATTGGKKGNEIIIQFLEQAEDYVDKCGKIFLITSSLAEKIDFRNLGFNSKLLKTKNFFFEKLLLLELTINE